MIFKKSILISNDTWKKVKNNNNFSLNKKNNKKKKKSSSPKPIKKPKLQEEQKHKLLYQNILDSIRYTLNEKAKEFRKKIKFDEEC